MKMNPNYDKRRTTGRDLELQANDGNARAFWQKILFGWLMWLGTMVTLRQDKLSETDITARTVTCVDWVFVAHCYQLLTKENKFHPDFIIYYVELNKKVSDQHCCNWTNLQKTSTWIIKFVSSERSSHWRFHWVGDFAATNSWTCVSTSALKWILGFWNHPFQNFG